MQLTGREFGRACAFAHAEVIVGGPLLISVFARHGADGARDRSRWLLDQTVDVSFPILLL
jgi:hypothetical protein